MNGYWLISIPDASVTVKERVTVASDVAISTKLELTVKLGNAGGSVSGSVSLLLIPLPIPAWIEQ